MEKISKENVVISLDISPANMEKVKIGKGNIFHPGVIIDTQGGEIIIGNNNIFEEKCRIYNLGQKVDGKTVYKPINIGNNNFFKVGAYVFTSNVGNCNVIGERANIEPFCNIKDGCEIVAGSKLPRYTELNHQVYSDINGISENDFFEEESYSEDYLILQKAIANQLIKNNQKKRRR